MNKIDILTGNGTYNRNYTKVTESRFKHDDFYDPRDLAQVKYEMLKAVRESEENVEKTAIRFGFSRAGFYKVKTAFEKEGVSAFVSNKTGPQNAWKLTKEYRDFIDSYLQQKPDTGSEDIIEILKSEKGLKISKRTIERYRSKKK